MKPPGRPDTHLTYCTNIHPGESYADLCRIIEQSASQVKADVCPDAPFGLGLRISGPCADELCDASLRSDLAKRLADGGFYLFTINGFPYGTFHGEPVKRNVYRPDWLEPERVAYTKKLGALLSELLPVDIGTGSISTVPGAFKDRCTSDDARSIITKNLIDAALYLHHLEIHTGKRITLAIEPEPGCMLETIDEAITFFETDLQSDASLDFVQQQTGYGGDKAAELVLRHLGLCLDACHQAVEFEAPATIVETLRAHGVPIYKLQLSAGLSVDRANQEALAKLPEFSDQVYLHQTTMQQNEGVIRFNDLPEAEQSGLTGTGEARVHFHVPLFMDELPPFQSTRPFLESLLSAYRAEPFCSHLEIETYSFGVLPEQFRTMTPEQAVARELQWVLESLGTP